MGTTITLKRLKQRGYVSMQELYEQLNPSFRACPVFSGNRCIRDPYVLFWLKKVVV